MKTGKLIEMLSTNIEPVKPRDVEKTMSWAIVVGGAAAFCVMLTTVGLRTEAGNTSHLTFLAVKLLFTLSLIGLGATVLLRLARPGQDGRRLFILTFLPIAVIALAGLAALVFERPMAWGKMIFGMNWVTCLFCIPLFAVIPFVALIWVLRQEAPTALRRTGLIAGLVAGALGATAYAFHCADDSIPFIAVWYGAMVAFCAFVGALIGPRLLRW